MNNNEILLSTPSLEVLLPQRAAQFSTHSGTQKGVGPTNHVQIAEGMRTTPMAETMNNLTLANVALRGREMAESEEKQRVLQQAFQEVHQSYREAMERTFLIQVMTLEFAHKLLEDDLQQTQSRQEFQENRELLRSLYINSTKQRKELERLLQEANLIYTNTLQAVFETYGEET